MRVWASCEALLVPCEALDLLRQAFVERFDGPFGDAIEADERHHRSAFRDAEYMPAALLPQQGQRGLNDSKRAEEVRP